MDVVQQHSFQAPVLPGSNVDKPPMLQQQSVIQSNQQLQQQLQSMHDENHDGQKRREILTRRPSYRLGCFCLHSPCILLHFK